VLRLGNRPGLCDEGVFGAFSIAIIVWNAVSYIGDFSKQPTPKISVAAQFENHVWSLEELVGLLGQDAKSAAA